MDNEPIDPNLVEQQAEKALQFEQSARELGYKISSIAAGGIRIERQASDVGIVIEMEFSCVYMPIELFSHRGYWGNFGSPEDIFNHLISYVDASSRDIEVFDEFVWTFKRKATLHF